MPELPEVETIVRGLEPYLVGQSINKVQINLAKTAWIDSVRATGETEIKQFKTLVEGKTIEAITRRGKMIIINLSESRVLLIHLKMTGQLIFVDSSHRLGGGHPNQDMLAELPTKSTRVVATLSNGTLFFNDQRQFGYIKLITAQSLQNHKAYIDFGPEPLGSLLTEQYFYAISNKRSIKIKQLIMDQSIIAGVGNIYADESLFEAGIHPARPANTLSQAEVAKLLASIRLVLQRGIKFGGTSSQHYLQSNGQKGTMQEHLLVYRRNGLPCFRCGHTISKIVVGGRGTHFCPDCQPL